MRATGYILLILGFVWLTTWCAGSVEPLTHSIAIENFKKYPPSKVYSDEDVSHAIRTVLAEYNENAHSVLLPALIMAVGGIVLDLAARRSSKTSRQE
jgi:hypothetical protein